MSCDQVMMKRVEEGRIILDVLTIVHIKLLLLYCVLTQCMTCPNMYLVVVSNIVTQYKCIFPLLPVITQRMLSL